VDGTLQSWRSDVKPGCRRTLQYFAIVVLLGVIAFAALALYVYKQSIGKFELRRLSLPTRIFADYTPLTAGQPQQPDDLVDKLVRLGYRQQPGGIAQSGDFAVSHGQIDIYTRAFQHPTGNYPSQPIRIAFNRGVIASVVSLREAQPVTNAALEPELLTSILSEQLENRRPVTLAQVPQSLQDAVVVTEDVRFWHHPGVDPIGIVRAVFRNLRAGGVAEGGSTLTQQLVKNYYLTSERSFKRKIVEAFMAIILDAKYSKQEILEAYLNDIYLGRNRSISIVGVGEASHYYFGKPVSEIKVPEAALLAGMIRSPNNFSPFVNPDKALGRRNTVLQLMLNNRKIDQATYEKAINAPLPRMPFRERSGLTSIPFYVDRVLQEMATDYGIKDVKGRGLAIYTAIDLGAQDFAARTITGSIASLERGSRRLRRPSPLQGVLIHVDVPTGEIRALVGGRNYDQSQFNRALFAKRQIGSLVKPFVYLTALEPSLSGQQVTQATLVSDSRFVLKRRFAPDWSPRNYQDEYHGTVTVREALEQSMNSASVRLGLAAGLDAIVKTAHTLGVQTELDTQPAMLLGAIGIPPIEMADAFSTIARVGNRLPLHTIRFVTDDRGKVLTAGGAQPVQVFPARDTFILLNMMQGVLDRGTAAGARSMGFRLRAAGKTGTTNDLRDAWFIGFTPKTLALTWIGFDDNSPVGLSGGQGAVPIWTRYMLQETAGQQNADWAPPAGIVMASVDETSGGLAVPQCPPNVIINEAFKDGTQPTQPCPLHSPAAPPPMQLDQFGNPIQLDTTGSAAVPSETTGTTLPEPAPEAPAPPPPSTDTTLTGGVFKTDTRERRVPPPTNTDTTSTTATTDTSSTSTSPP
jgi:penicillin-binding protein 1B